MVAIRDILHPGNALNNRGLVINHRNVGYNALLFGLHIHELVLGVIFTFVFALRSGFIVFFLAGTLWVLTAYIRRHYTPWQLIAKPYRRYILKPNYFVYSEDLSSYEDFLNKKYAEATRNAWSLKFGNR